MKRAAQGRLCGHCLRRCLPPQWRYEDCFSCRVSHGSQAKSHCHVSVGSQLFVPLPRSHTSCPSIAEACFASVLLTRTIRKIRAFKATNSPKKYLSETTTLTSLWTLKSSILALSPRRYFVLSFCLVSAFSFVSVSGGRYRQLLVDCPTLRGRMRFGEALVSHFGCKQLPVQRHQNEVKCEHPAVSCRITVRFSYLSVKREQAFPT